MPAASSRRRTPAAGRGAKGAALAAGAPPATAPPVLGAPRIYALDRRAVEPLDAFGAHLDRAARLGFDTVLIPQIFRTDESGDALRPRDHQQADPRLGPSLPTSAALTTLAAGCQARGLRLTMDLAIHRFSAEHPLVAARKDAFAVRRADNAVVDPRRPSDGPGTARARLDEPASAALVADWAAPALAAWVAAGVSGFRILQPEAAPASFWRTLFAAAAAAPDSQPLFIAETQGLSRSAISALAGAGFGAATSSLAWWDGRSPWLVEEYETLRRIGPVIATLAAPRAGPGAVDPVQALRRALALAAVAGSGILAAVGFDDPPDGVSDAALVQAIRDANAQTGRLAGDSGALRTLTGAAAPVTALLRSDAGDVRVGRRAMLALINPSWTAPVVPDPAVLAGVEFGPFSPLTGGDAFAALAPGEVRLLTAERRPAIVGQPRAAADAAQAAAQAPRLVVEGISPAVAGGDFAVKRVLGEAVVVEADVFADGHDLLAVELQWRALDEAPWTRARMTLAENSRWRGQFTPQRLGRHEFRVEAWFDRFGGFRRDFRKKLDAGVATPVDAAEGVALIRSAADGASGEPSAGLAALAAELETLSDDQRQGRLLADETAALMAHADPRPFRHASTPQRVDAERLAARFSSWYELFPRSQSDSPQRHGDFDDVIKRLPAIRAMGFDTLYFPPIHPIGVKNRKGRNNSLTAGPDDPGSPYAIGADSGGHDAIHPALGSFEDFRRLIRAASDHGLELALDFAIQCSPDHPWLKQHPGWFDWRPDGSIKYAENPPKKYEDIVNVDFYAVDAVPDLWIALRDIVLLWVREGVKTFRVDNPHTKPLPFWEWMIGEVRQAHPEVIFLAEAFTHPKMMYRLAKIGFSQSYSYFTWREHKAELTDYLTELTTTAPKEFFRPHFFVNTPDINPYFLQRSGRAGFLIRAALAATLSGLWGVYSGFELLESDPVPGKEDYLNSEKYEIKPRDWTAPGNIIGEISRLNQIRKSQPALQSHLGVEFFNAWNDRVLYFGKMTPGGQDMVLVAISLDPHNAQTADVEIPLWRFGLDDDGAFAVEDLLHDHRFVWRGKRQSVRLDPTLPYALWRVQPESR